MGRGARLAFLAPLALALSLLPSCKDDINAPPDETPPAAVADLQVSSRGVTFVDLLWTNTGDDGRVGRADVCEVRALAGRPILTEADWNAALDPVQEGPPCGEPGSVQPYHYADLEPDSLYGFAVRILDSAGNRSPLSNSLTARTNPEPPPIVGYIDVRLRSMIPLGFSGARIVWERDGGDSILVEQAHDSLYSFPFLPGPCVLRLEQSCASISPNARQTVEILELQHHEMIWSLDPTAGVVVTSSPAGADILLDGIFTSQTTPATLTCLEPGNHEICVRWHGVSVGADSVRQITVGTEPVRLDYRYPRGALLELITATLCPNCPVADAAAESLWTRDGLAEAGYIGLQVHASWGGTDPFANASTINRSHSYYQSASGLPRAFLNGTWSLTGIGTVGTIESVIQMYRDQALLMMGDPEKPAPFALTWSEAARVPGQEVTGRLTVTVLESVADPAGTEVWILDYKDNLVTFVPVHQRDETFFKVVREYRRLGSLSELGLTQPGQRVIFDVRFDIAGDTRWSESGMGLVGFVQHMNSREVFQAAHASVP